MLYFKLHFPASKGKTNWVYAHLNRTYVWPQTKFKDETKIYRMNVLTVLGKRAHHSRSFININVSCRKAAGFHRWAKNFAVNFLIRKTFCR